MNYYYRYPGDYGRDTGDLSLAAHGAFALLLDAFYSTEKPLPKNPVGLYRLTRAFTQEEQLATDEVIRRFFVETPDGYINARAIEEIDSAKARIDAARANGSKGGRRKNKPTGQPNVNPVGSVPVTHGQPTGQALQPPTTINTSSKEEVKQPRQRASSSPEVARPDDVSEQVWGDWVKHRKAKKATITETVINGAKSEAVKAGISLDDFLTIWCTRGTQGLQADWIKPEEKAQFNRSATGKHAGFQNLDYHAGVNADGTFN